MKDVPRVLVIDDVWGKPGAKAIDELYPSPNLDFLLEPSLTQDGDYSSSVAVDRVAKETEEGLQAVLLDILFDNYPLGVEILERLRERFPLLPILMLTTLEYGDKNHRETVVRCMELGANEYIEKAPDESRMRAILDVYLSPESDLVLYGNSRVLRELRASIARVSFSRDASVLIVGESGTGKELIARALHRQGPRKRGRFVAKNCAHSETQLLDSELFGHEKGAFTGAQDRQIGLLEEANEGVLFLDEIADMPLPLQAKLLRVLESRSFRRLGGREDLQSDFQLVCATNRPPKALITEGKLRDDLYYRINTMTLTAPPLRDHVDDIPIYVDLFIKKFKTRGGCSYPGQRFDKDAMQNLRLYSWPGNVREVRNVVERAIILSKTEVMSKVMLPSEITGANCESPSAVGGRDPFSVPDLPKEWPRHRLAAELRMCVQAKEQIQQYKGKQWKAEFMRLMYPECKAANAKGFDDLIRRLTKGPWGDSRWQEDATIRTLIEALQD